jgi:SAM-dependent methyltransferase
MDHHGHEYHLQAHHHCSGGGHSCQGHGGGNCKGKQEGQNQSQGCCQGGRPKLSLAGGGTSWLTRWFLQTFANALTLCLGELDQEPKRILYVGGCRQQALARQLALLFPVSHITLVDPDSEVVQKAEQEIHCRFRFVHAPVEALPFEPDSFDFIFIHNVFEFATDWQRAMDELGRVGNGQMLLTFHKQNRLWRLWGRHVRSIGQAFREMGTRPAESPLMDRYPLLTALWRYARPQMIINAYPFWLVMSRMNPVREERLILADAPAC